jgi:hypothetical protein
MIDNLDKLYRHANRFGLTVRRDDSDHAEDRLGVSISGQHVFFNGRAVTEDDLPHLEVSTRKGWVPLAEFDEAAEAAMIERFEGLRGFEAAIEDYERVCERLRSSWEKMHADDRLAFPFPDELASVELRPTDEYRKGLLK